MLCPICGLRDLEFTVEETTDFMDSRQRPDVSSIVCKARGTGSLTKCHFTRGSLQFSMLVEMYWLEIESGRAVTELIQRQNERMQNVVYRLYKELEAVEAQRVARMHLPEQPTRQLGKLFDDEKPKDGQPK